MRPYRSLLFVPAHREGWHLKALRAPIDALILDLEDAVPDDAKPAARESLASTVAETRAASPTVGVVVRINTPGSPWGHDDVAAAVAADVDAILVPKVDSAHDLVRLDAVLEHEERRQQRLRAVEVIASLESARGLLAAGEIAAAPRVGGALAAAARDGDTARSVGFRWSATGHETLAWRTNVVLSCRAAGDRHPVVGLWQEINDLDGLAAFAASNRDLGFRGQVIIHPSHAEVVNAAYTPPPSLIAYYEDLIHAWEEARSAGTGAVVFDGDHIDVAHVQTARDQLDFARSLPHHDQP